MSTLISHFALIFSLLYNIYTFLNHDFASMTEFIGARHIVTMQNIFEENSQPLINIVKKITILEEL